MIGYVLLCSLFHLVLCEVAQRSQTVFVGQNVKIKCEPQYISGDGPVTYVWEKPIGTVIGRTDTLELRNIRILDAGVYTCRATQYVRGVPRDVTASTSLAVRNIDSENGGGEQPPTPADVLPTIVFSPEDVEYKEVSEISYYYFVCDVLNKREGEFSIKWYKENGQEVSANNVFFENPASKSKEGRYYCRVMRTDGSGRVYNKQLDLRVKVPQVLVEVKQEVIRIGGSVHRRCYMEQAQAGIDSFNYRWYDPLGQVRSENEVLQFTLTDASQYGVYRCEASDRSGRLKYQANTIVRPVDNGNRDIAYAVRVTADQQLRVNEQYRIQCEVSPRPPFTVEYTWFRGETEVGKGAQLVIPSFKKEDQGMYECRTSWNDGTSLQRIAQRNQMDVSLKLFTHAKVELTNPPGPQIAVRLNDRKELHCEIDLSLGVRGTDVRWYFEGRLLDRPATQALRIGRHDARYVSIISLKNIQDDNEGLYSCRVLNVEKEVRIIVIQDKKVIEINPLTQTVDEGSYSEFHCRVDNYKNVENKDLTWEFISKDGLRREPLDLRPGRWVREDAQQAKQTSFISLENTRKSDEGYYVCREPGGDTVRGELIVNARLSRSIKLLVSPSIIRVRPNQRFAAECLSFDDQQNPAGDPVFYFTNRRELTTDSRLKVRLMNTSHIEVSAPNGLSARDNGTVLECRLNDKMATVTILIEDICQPGFRRCRNGDCISSGQFCDGRRDCADGSDEDTAYCSQCDPLSRTCERHQGNAPVKNSYLFHWACDGEDDCGNGYDESNCANEAQLCGGLTYNCRDRSRVIPRAFLCDKENDCASGDDEYNCNNPVIVEAPGNPQQRMYARQDETITLTCESRGNPQPRIIWRFNWGCLPDEARMKVTSSPRGCDTMVSQLTITRFRAGDDGIYNCEAMSGQLRALSSDYMVVLRNT